MSDDSWFILFSVGDISVAVTEILGITASLYREIGRDIDFVLSNTKIIISLRDNIIIMISASGSVTVINTVVHGSIVVV